MRRMISTPLRLFFVVAISMLVITIVAVRGDPPLLERAASEPAFSDQDVAKADPESADVVQQCESPSQRQEPAPGSVESAFKTLS